VGIAGHVSGSIVQVVAGVVAGVGFLGAGLIFRGEQGVQA